jgi:hypothetical protein
MPLPPTLENRPDPQFKLVFLDSGAHSLWNIYVGKMGNKAGYAYYDSPEFYAYCDRYASFVKAYPKSIDFYANIDVIYDPERSWKVLKYLENEHGLDKSKLVPVIHYGAGPEWVDRHLEAGYQYLGIGGLGQGVTKNMYLDWGDALFTQLCPASNDYLPLVRTHGFAMTAIELMWRYPWFSVDSSTWTKVGAYGNIFVAKKVDGQFYFHHELKEKRPYMMCFSNESKIGDEASKHYNRGLSKGEKGELLEWLDEIEVPLGDDNTEGITNSHSCRKLANLLFFERVRKSLPKYPWAYTPRDKERSRVI